MCTRQLLPYGLWFSLWHGSYSSRRCNCWGDRCFIVNPVEFHARPLRAERASGCLVRHSAGSSRHGRPALGSRRQRLWSHRAATGHLQRGRSALRRYAACQLCSRIPLLVAFVRWLQLDPCRVKPLSTTVSIRPTSLFLCCLLSAALPVSPIMQHMQWDNWLYWAQTNRPASAVLLPKQLQRSATTLAPIVNHLYEIAAPMWRPKEIPHAAAPRKCFSSALPFSRNNLIITCLMALVSPLVKLQPSLSIWLISEFS